MKGISILKNCTKYLPNKNSRNISERNILGLNSSFFHTENKNKLNFEKQPEKKNFLKQIAINNFFDSTTIYKKFKFSLTNIMINYYNKLQMLYINNQINELAVLKLSGDKNNVNGENKNLNDNDLNIKLNNNAKEKKNSDGKLFLILICLDFLIFSKFSNFDLLYIFK